MFVITVVAFINVITLYIIYTDNVMQFHLMQCTAMQWKTMQLTVLKRKNFKRPVCALTIRL